MPIKVEVCERVMDYHYVPQRKADGTYVVHNGRVPVERAPKYHAQIEGKPGFWSCGTSRDEAVGNLIRDHPGAFGIVVEDIGKQAR